MPHRRQYNSGNMSLRHRGRLLTGALAITACAVNPATGRRQLMLVSEGQEITMGREADPEVVGQFGLYPDSVLQRYVAGLGDRLALLAERPALPWTFRVVDDPIVNAFALPGGFIYVTRGIMAYFNSEAELVAVLGHEIGHVTARHSAQQLSQQQLAQVSLVAGMVLAPELQDFAGLAQAGLGLLFLKFSRDDEREADDLGLRYMTAARYDAREMPNVFAMLARVSQGSGGGRAPAWLSTHPDPADRQARIQQQIAGQSFAGTAVNRDPYLRRLDGLIFGPDPRQGFFREERFLHPELRFQIAFPVGWRTSNQRQAVLAQSPSQDALIQLTLAEEPTPSRAVSAFVGRQGIRAGAVRSHAINGLPAASARFEAITQRDTLAGVASAVAYEGNVYRVVGLAAATRWARYELAVTGSIETFDRLTDRAALAVQPLRLEIVTLDRPMTLREFAARYPSQVSLESLALLNGVEPAGQLEAGRLVKRVVGGPLPE